MLLFTCPKCEVFSIGEAVDFLKFMEKHGEGVTEAFSFENLTEYMHRTLRLFNYFEQVGNFSRDDLVSLLIDTFSVERDRLIAEKINKEKKGHLTEKQERNEEND